MLCKQCGSPNKEGSLKCNKCGAFLNDAVPVASGNKKIGLIMGLISGGVVLIAAAVVLVLLFAGGASVDGAWHSDELNQMLRFHDNNGTVVIRTPLGDLEATFVFDKVKSQGVISLNGEAVAFSIVGDSLILNDSTGTQSAFLRGEMDIVSAMAQVTHTPEPSDTPVPSASATPEPSDTPVPSASATPAPSEKPSKTTEPNASPIIINPPPAVSLKPGIDSSVLFTPLDSVVGVWSKNEFTLTFYDDKTYELANGTKIYDSGAYTYNALTKSGEIVVNGSVHMPFTVSGDKLTLQDSAGSVLTRN